MSHNNMDLDSMKYAELQKLAKELGLKAKVKADKLLKMIRQHYEEKEQEEEQVQQKDVVQEDDKKTAPASAEEGVSVMDDVGSIAVFVNTRRGKGAGTKRKISDTTTETQCDGKSTTSAAKVDTEVAVSMATRGARGAKKRKVSAVKDSEENENEQVTEGEQQQAHVKEEAPVRVDAEEKKVPNAGRIPRLQQQQKKKQLLKPITPNFKKLHEAHFNKLESIDSYVQRKTKQMDTYRASVKELKKLSEKTKLQKIDGKPQTKENQSRTSLFSPAVVTKKPPPANKGAGKEDAPFRPSVLSTRRINVRFSEATWDNEHKMSLVKTPARRSSCVTSSTPNKRSASAVKSNKTFTFSATKTPDASGPFVFTGDTSAAATPGTQKKPNFDLKASLSRPLSYKPHKGKLKPFAEAKESATTTAAANKSLIANTHQGSYKQHHVQTREDRREKVVADRKQKKQSMLGARRGLAMM